MAFVGNSVSHPFMLKFERILCLKHIISLANPVPPVDVRASEITATTVRLEWNYNNEEELQYYVIQYKPKYANQVSYHSSLTFSNRLSICTFY